MATGWGALLGGRLVGAILTTAAGSVIIFLLMKMSPGDPAIFVLGDFATPDAVARFRAENGLDRPLGVQLWAWLSRMAVGDFGMSLSLHRGHPIAELIGANLPNTVFLGTYALALSVAFSLVLGSLSALMRGTVADTAITTASVLGVSMPDFWLGYVLVLVFALWLGWFPAYGFVGPLESLPGALVTGFLPALAAAAPISAAFTRVLRVSLLETLNRDYVRTARSFGVAPVTVFSQFALRNALVPYITVIGLQIRFLLGGIVVIEKIFGVPGIGSLMVDAIFARDFLLVQACAVTFLVAVIAANLAVDLACVALDPRRSR